MPWYDKRFRSYKILKSVGLLKFCSEQSGIPQNLDFWLPIKCNQRQLPIPTLQLTFSTFRRLLLHHNWINGSVVMVSEICRWLLEILIWTERRNFSTSGFERKQSKIWGNSEYQSRREFHKLSKESGNSEFWYRTNKAWMVEVDRIFEIWLQVGIDFLKFILVFKVHFLMQYECMMSCIMLILYIPRQKKKVIKYRWRTYSRWQITLIPVVSSSVWLMQMWLPYLQKSTINIWYTSSLILQVALMHLTLHGQRCIRYENVLTSWGRDHKTSQGPHALGARSWSVTR
jgi:hypothetical protein